MFKHRIDRRSLEIGVNYRDIQSALEGKTPDDIMFEALRRLERLDLVMASPEVQAGYFRLTKRGKETDVEMLLEDRLRVGFGKRKRFESLIRLSGWTSAIMIPAAFYGVISTLIPVLRNDMLLLICGYVFLVGTLSLFCFFFGISYLQTRTNEETLFTRLFESYLALKDDRSQDAEKSVRKAADILRSPTGLAHSDWSIVRKDLTSIFQKIGREVYGRVLPAIVQKHKNARRVVLELADFFANASLQELDAVVEATQAVPAGPYRRLTRWETLKADKRLYQLSATGLVLVLAAGLDLAVFLSASTITGVELPTFYVTMATAYIPSILAILGLMTLLQRIRQ